MFTREHFEKIASTLSAAHSDPALDDGARTVLHNLTQTFADIFAESNERFSRKAFVGACNAASRSEIRRLVNQTNIKTRARNRAREAIRRSSHDEQKARV